MTTRKKKRRAAPDSPLAQFLTALATHQKHEDEQNAAREERTTKRIEAWLQEMVGEVKAAVREVKDYQISVARAVNGENGRLSVVEKQITELRSRVETLEAKCEDDGH